VRVTVDEADAMGRGCADRKCWAGPGVSAGPVRETPAAAASRPGLRTPARAGARPRRGRRKLACAKTPPSPGGPPWS